MCLWCFDVIPHVVFSFSVRALFLAICFNHTQLPFVSFKRLIKPPLRIQPRGNLIWLDVKSVTRLGLNINQLSISFLHIPVFNQVSPLWPYTPLYSGDMTSPRQLNNGAFSVVVILVICSTTLHLPPHNNINSRIVARQNVGINKLSAMAYLALAFYKNWSMKLIWEAIHSRPALGLPAITALQKLWFWRSSNVLASEWSRPALRGIMRLVTECHGCHPSHRDTSHSTGQQWPLAVSCYNPLVQVNWKISILDTCLKYVGGDILWSADG